MAYGEAVNSFSELSNLNGTDLLARILRLPDFSDEYTYTRTKSGISDAEFKKLIVEQAYMDYSNGKFQNKSADFVSLMKKYVSEVSPDRKGIISAGLKKIASDNQAVLEPINVVAILLEGKV